MSQERSNTGKRPRSVKFYALKIDDCPGWPLGTTVIAMQGAWKEREIEAYDKVIYHDRQGVAHFGFVEFAGDDLILNKNLSPDLFPGQPTVIVSRKEIKRVDLVVMISFIEEGADQILRGIRQRHALRKYLKA